MSPESALHALENAYRNRDIEAAVTLKDFVSEARLMMAQLGDDKAADEEIQKSVAETLELSYRVDIQENGFPDFSKLECTVVAKELREPQMMALDEVCKDLSGNIVSRQVILASKSEVGWRIIGLDDSQH